MTERTDRLGIGRMEEVAEFLLNHMSMETRGKLMAELPQHYALLYPTVSTEKIIDVVRRGLWELRKEPKHINGQPTTKHTSASDRKMINGIREARGLVPLTDEHFDAMDELQQRGER